MESELNKLAPQQTAKKLFDKNQAILNSKLNKYLSVIEAKIDVLHSTWKKILVKIEAHTTVKQ